MLPFVMPGLAAIDLNNRVAALDSSNLVRFGSIFLWTFDDKKVA
jgi:hypothetical protein